MNRRTALSLLASCAGAALLVWQVRRVGIAAIHAGLVAVGSGFLLILLLSLLRFLLRSAAWTTLIGERASVAQALAATIAGDALGNLTPLSLLVSEPAKAIYLGRDVGSARALAALTAENFFYSVSVAIYIVLGTAAMLVAYGLPDVVRWAGVASLAAMAVVLAAAAWLAWQQPALASAVVARVPFVKLEHWIDRVRDFEVQAYGSVGHEGGRLGVVVLCESAFHVMSFLEAWLTVWLLTGVSSPIAAFVLDTFSRIVNVVFRVVPLRLGVDQVSAEIVAEAIGLPTAMGTTLSLVRTGRQLTWAVVGLGLLARRGMGSQKSGVRSPKSGRS